MLETFRLAWKVVEHHWMVYRKNLFSNSSITISDPIFFTLAFGFGLGAYVQDIDGRSYLIFMAPGLAAGAALLTSFFECSYGTYFRLNFDGTFKAMLTSPVGVSEIIFGELLWVAIKGAFMTFVISFVLGVFGLIQWPFIWLVPIAGALVGVACGSIGLLATTLVKNIDQFQVVYSFLIAPIYFLSGMFFPIHPDQGWIYWLVQISPLYHGTRLVQSFLWQDGIAENSLIHFPALILLTGILGVFAYRRFKRKLQLI